jgi:hypothetical protein
MIRTESRKAKELEDDMEKSEFRKAKDKVEMEVKDLIYRFEKEQCVYVKEVGMRHKGINDGSLIDWVNFVIS